MKKIFGILILILVLLFTSCSCLKYEYREVDYTVFSVSPLRTYNFEDVLTLMLQVNLNSNKSESASIAINDIIEKSDLSIYNYYLIISDSDIRVPQMYQSINLKGPHIYKQNDVIKVKVRCRKFCNGKWVVDPIYPNEFTSEGMWY